MSKQLTQDGDFFDAGPDAILFAVFFVDVGGAGVGVLDECIGTHFSQIRDFYVAQPLKEGVEVVEVTLLGSGGEVLPF